MRVPGVPRSASRSATLARKTPIQASLDGHGFRKIAGLIDVAALGEGHMIRQELQGNVEQDGIELRLRDRDSERAAHTGRYLPFVGDEIDETSARADLLDRGQVLRKELIAWHHDDR